MSNKNESRTSVRRVAAFWLATLLAAAPSSIEAAGEIDFNRDVRPILSDKCYFCHGPDEEKREADLRLDDSESAREVLEDGEVMRRLHSDDEYEVMPPPETNLKVTEEEAKTIEDWIASGAQYESHWAFEPLPAEVAVPETASNANWANGPIDKFVAESLAQRELSPTPEATPARWLRRVTFDLTGLPPRAEDLDRFEQSPTTEGVDSDTAYQAEVRRLLSSKEFGEHLASGWLDSARYADSYGYQSDKLNTQWPYRDWVVDAINKNLPYDQFITWQLAGDLLENPTSEQRLATAFNRLHRLNNEGGAVFEEWRLENVADRVHTFGTAVLGLTLECCRCHDHKYDPIPTRDYYSLSAFFNSIDENGVYDNSEKVPAPSLLLPTDEQALKLEEARRAVEEAEMAYSGAVAGAEQRFRQQPPAKKSLAKLPDLVRSLSFDVPFNEALKDIYYTGDGDANRTKPLATVEVADNPLPRLEPSLSTDGASTDEAKSSVTEESAPPRLAVRLDGERGVVMPGVEPFDRWTPFSLVVSMRETSRVAIPAVIAQNSRGQLAFNGWDLIIADGYLESRMYRVWPGNAIGVRTKEPIPADQWQQVTATYDGSSKAAGLQLYANGKELETEILRDHITKQAMVKVMHGGKLTIGQRFRDRGLDGGLIDDVRVYSRALSPTEVAHLATGEPVEVTADCYANAMDDVARAALAELTAAREWLVMAEEVVQEIPVMGEMPEPRETHILARGAYDAPTSEGTRVQRATFSELYPPFPKGFPKDRLGLARWATLPDHPLTARVIVNRLWANFFGYGLVRTPENFGLQGELPTHPELLDWLARDFIDNGWDIKRLCDQIALSASYRQDSVVSSELSEDDPENRWLARGPGYRLSAEQIRDLALATSGRLNPKKGGPPVSPYQAGDDLWKESNSMSPAYKQSVGKDLYRRSLYSVWKRTAPLPNMMAFDTDLREVCTVKRARTNTPLQALVLLNDEQFVEAARSLAERAMKRPAAERIAWAFRELAGRRPDAAEQEILARLLAGETTHYEANPGEAGKLILAGESTPDASFEPAELAAMTVVCQAILNLDATIWKR